MNEMMKTVVFAGAAGVLALVAGLTSPSAPKAAIFRDQGQPFFPDFKDPFAAKSLQVVEYDAAESGAAVFKVEFKGGRWVIPSHHDYPADAKDRLAKTATSVMDIRKESIRSTRKEDHAACGVIDPEDPSSADPKDRGRRITLRDGSGNVLADLIIGRKADPDGSRWFVRVPDQKFVYAVNMEVDLSTKFSDWIETDLLQIDPAQVWGLTMKNYSVKEDARAAQLVPGETWTAEKPREEWTTEGLAADEEVSSEVVGTMTSTLKDLKIVGVRKKPEALTRDLKKNKMVAANEAVFYDLMNRGFFMAEDGLYSKEGELEARCADGVVYVLRFGSVFTGSGLALTSGEEEKKEPGKDEKKDKPAAGTESRYLMITVRFDENAVQPEKMGDPPKAGFRVDTKPWSRWRLEQLDEDRQKKFEEASKAWQQAVMAASKNFNGRKEAGEKRAKQLTDRFADWYYVIGADAFGKLHIARKDLVKGKGKPAGPELPGGGGDPDEPHQDR